MDNKKGFRQLHTKVKTAKGRKKSSTKWLQRQLNDPYVKLAKKDGYRSRAAYKLLEIDDKFKLLVKGNNVLDLGAAPGGWSQVAIKKVMSGRVIAVDIQELEPIEGVEFLRLDFLQNDAPDKILEKMAGIKMDVVLSDMAASSCGHAATDHLRIIYLLELAFDFAKKVLKQDGCFVGKILQGGTEKELLSMLKNSFTRVKHYKPPASRLDSSEMYVIATGFKEI